MTSQDPELRGGWLLPAVLSVTAGAVDAIGFLALGGLFTAHITGNVVVLAAHYVTGSFSEVGPLLAVPVFIVALGVVTLASETIEGAGYAPRRTLLVLHAALLAACLGLGVGLGPFANADGPMAVLVGMLAVAAMATQNALVKLALPGVPSTAVMTTNTTELTIDLATLLWSRGDPDYLARARSRAGATFPAVVGFVAGCAAGAVLEFQFGLWALALPVVLAALAVPLGELRADDRAVHPSGSK
ncbi:MAG TPA: YoaK family protein [Gemmataceae bacterium]|nr:YoaK family protein [Gemmataceae bacterium]